MLSGDDVLRRYLKKQRLLAPAFGAIALLVVTRPVAADGCLLHPAKLADSAVDGFKGRPQALLDDHPEGGVVMTAAVRRLAGSDVATVSQLVSLANGASVPQVVALGAGLAGAANVCRQKRPDLSQMISDEVKRANVPALFVAFAASLSSRQAAAMGGPEGLATTGRVLAVEPQVKAPPQEELESDTAPRKRQTEQPRSSFGSGGVVRTVVKPVSPAR
jgi:hypothetical protein